MIRKTRVLVVAIAAITLLPALGCSSFSASSESSSDIISSPVTSISASSRSISSPEAGYEDEVGEFTEAHVKAGGDAPGLMREVTRMAENSGISDWEKSDATWRGIGSGLKRAGLSQTKYEAWRGLLTDDPAKAKLLDAAFR